MTKEQKIIELNRMLKRCPDILSPMKVCKWSPLGKNKVYELIKQKKLKAFIYQGGYIITKDDLIDYLAEHSDDKSKKHFTLKKDGDRR